VITEHISFLFVADLGRSEAFYSGLLGFELVVDQGDCRVYRITDTAFLGLCQRPDQVSPDGHIVTLLTNDVDGVHSRLVDAEVAVEQTPSHSDHYAIYQAFYRDPDGHLVEIQRFDDPSWSRPI